MYKTYSQKLSVFTIDMNKLIHIIVNKQISITYKLNITKNSINSTKFCKDLLK